MDDAAPPHRGDVNAASTELLGLVRERAATPAFTLAELDDLVYAVAGRHDVAPARLLDTFTAVHGDGFRIRIADAAPKDPRGSPAEGDGAA